MFLGRALPSLLAAAGLLGRKFFGRKVERPGLLRVMVPREGRPVRKFLTMTALRTLVFARNRNRIAGLTEYLCHVLAVPRFQLP